MTNPRISYPSNRMKREFKQLMKKAVFRVIDVEKITTKKNATREEEYLGMLCARSLVGDAKTKKKIKWSGKAKGFETCQP